MGNINTCGPNEVMVISGGCTNSKSYVVGGWGWAWWALSDVQRLSLEVTTLTPRCEHVETKSGVAITVTGCAQVKIMNDSEKDSTMLQTACEQFLGRTLDEVGRVVLETLEGHLRAIIGTLEVEEVYKDRESFASQVREIAAPDVGKMGVEILSFTIKDVFDKVDYLDSLGRTQTAIVKKNAEIGVATAEKDAGITEAECEREQKFSRYAADEHIANFERDCNMRKADFAAEVEAKRADAELSYNLQVAKERQRITQEEKQIEVVERHKQIDVESREIERKEKELLATIRLPAEAEAYKVEQHARADRFRKIALAEAEGEKTKLVGAAQASSIEAIGKAEAEKMRLKATAYKEYGDAAKTSLVLETLPQIAREISKPLSRIDEIVLLGDDKMSSTATNLIAQVPAAIQALTGVDIKSSFGAIPGATVTRN